MRNSLLHINPEELLNWIATIERGNEIAHSYLRNIPHLHLTYEDCLLDRSSHQKTVDKICHWLDVPSELVKSNLSKVTSERLVDMVENYEEIFSALKDSKYAYFLKQE
jgi:hypothetical protein